MFQAKAAQAKLRKQILDLSHSKPQRAAARGSKESRAMQAVANVKLDTESQLKTIEAQVRNFVFGCGCGRTWV